MKNVMKYLVAVLLAGVVFVACNKDDSGLQISNVVAENHDGGKEIPLGGTISVNFTAIAGDKARLDFYHIEIHDHPASGKVEDEYRIIDESFKDKNTFKGLRNANVHEHIVVPNEANLGRYHVVIVVVDEDGNSVDTEDVDVEIIIVE
jgi:hypothetical protein